MPVCGSDKITYWNMCKLKQTVCHVPEKTDLVVDYEGKCTGKCFNDSKRVKSYIKFNSQKILHNKINPCLYLIYTGIAPCLIQCKEFGIGKNQCRKACYCMDSCLKEIDTEDSHLVSQELIKCSKKCRKIYQGTYIPSNI